MSEPPETTREAAGVPRVPDDRDALRQFPRIELPPGSMVWRVHRTERRPWYFGDNGRFGLPPRSGTCYVAPDPLTSICETVIRGRTHIEPGELPRKSIRNMPIPKLFAMADVPAAGHFGLRRSFSTIEPYERCKEWAAALRAVGFGGIAYWPNHDPRRGDRLSYALFDAMGIRSWRVGGRAGTLDSTYWRERITDELSVTIRSEPDDPELDVTDTF